jgi:5'-nucleotidase
MLKLFIILILGIFISSCTSRQKEKVIQTTGFKKLYSRPDPIELEKLPAHLKKIIIVGTNDFHGNLAENLEKTKENPEKESVMIPVGGASIIANYMEILHKVYPQELVLVDGGDLYQGTMISNTFKGEPVVKFYNQLNYTALTIGNHEFDYGPERMDTTEAKESEDRLGALKKIIKQSKVPFVSSNIIDLKTGELVAWDGLHHALIKEINGVKIGFIGASTQETPWKTLKNNVRGLYFDDIAKVSIEFSQKLKAKGAQIVILITHAGMFCGVKEAKEKNIPIEVMNLDPKDSSSCNFDDELGKVLNRVSPGTLDAVVGGHTHSKIANFINQIPVIQSFSNGKYFGMIEFTFNTKENSIIQNETIIHQPTKFCHFFFEETQDCQVFDPTVDHSKTVPAQFLGEPIVKNKMMDKILEPYTNKVDHKIKQVIAHLNEPLVFNRQEESPLCNMVADALAHSTKTSIAITNSGGVRQQIEQGDVLYGQLYKSLPFDNYTMRLKITGKDLKDLVRIGTSGFSTGVLCMSGLKVEIDPGQDSAIDEDWNQDGIKDQWERNRLLSVKLYDGSEIKDDEFYEVGTQNFLGEQGGDFYGHVTDKIPATQKEILYTATYRDAVSDYLKKFNQNPDFFEKLKTPRIINK